jgi:hypothetical protein
MMDKTLFVGRIQMGEKEIVAIISLLQSIVWPLFILLFLFWLKRNYSEQVSMLFEAVRKRIKQGSSLKLGPVEIGELKELRDTVKQTQNFVDDLKAQYSSIENIYLATAQAFDPDSPVFDLDELASQLKSLASGLPNLDFMKAFSVSDISQPELYALSCALQVRPQADLAVPLASSLEYIAERPNLSNFRLRTIYRSILALENIIRVDDRKVSKNLGTDDRLRIKEALVKLKESPRCADDNKKYKDKSIVTRIDKLIKLL